MDFYSVFLFRRGRIGVGGCLRDSWSQDRFPFGMGYGFPIVFAGVWRGFWYWRRGQVGSAGSVQRRKPRCRKG